MAKKAKGLSADKKIAIGAGVAAVIGAVLCHIYCPRCNKDEELFESGEPEQFTDQTQPAGGTAPLAFTLPKTASPYVAPGSNVKVQGGFRQVGPEII